MAELAKSHAPDVSLSPKDSDGSISCARGTVLTAHDVVLSTAALKSAEERAKELTIANHALKRSVPSLVEASDVDAALIEAARTAIEAVNAALGALALFMPDKPFIEGVARQAALAIRMLDLAEQAKQKAVEETIRKAAQERTAQLARANAVLMSSVEAVAISADPKLLLEHFLLEAMKVAGAPGGAFTLYDNGHFQDFACVAILGKIVPEEIWRNEPFILETPAVLEANISGFFARLMHERITRDTVEDAWNWWPAAAEFHQRSGHVEVWNVACIARDEVIASFWLGFAVVPERESVEPMLIALAQQAALALELHRLSAQAKKQAILHEKEIAAQERAAELAKANEMLRRTAEDLVKAEHRDDIPVLFLRHAIQLAGASGGALLRRTSETEFTFEAIVQGDEVFKGRELSELPIAHEVRETSRQDPKGHFARLAAGEIVWCIAEDLQAAGPLDKTKEWHDKKKQQALWDVPFKIGNRVAGYVGLAFQHCDQPTTVVKETINALANQVGVAMELMRFAASEQEVAVAREQEKAAQYAALEMSKANQALQSTIEALDEANNLNQVVPRVLGIVAKIFDSESCALYENDAAGTVWLRYWNVNGRTLLPEELLQIDPNGFALIRSLAEGFQVPDAYLGSPVTELIGPVVVNHWQGTAVPEFDRFAVNTGWDIELNVGLGAGGLRSSTLCIYRGRTRPFAPEEIALAESLAKQLGLGLQFARLADEARQAAVALEREKAVQERAQQLADENEALQAVTDALAEARSLDEIVPSVLSILSRALASPSAAYYEIEGQETIYLRYYFNEGRVITAAKLLAGSGDPPYDLPRRLAQGYQLDEAYFGTKPLENRLTRVIDHRAGTSEPAFDEWRRKQDREMELNIPLYATGVGFGALTISRTADNPFRTDEIELAETLVKQLSLAVQAYRLAAESESNAIAAAVAKEQEKAAKARADELAAVNQTITASFRRIATQSDTVSAPPIFLSDIARAASAELCYWLDYDSVTDSMALSLRCKDGVILDQPEPDEPEVFSSPFSARLLGDLFHPSAAYQLRVLSVENDADRLWPATAEWHRRAGRKQVLCFPVSLGDRPIGMLGMAFRQETDWSQAKMELIRSLASHLALAVHLSRLSEQASRGAAMEERTRLAREIHDTLAQGFSGILVQLRAMQQAEGSQDHTARTAHFENALELASNGLTEARRSLASLRLRELEGRSFREALTLMAQSAMKRGGIPIRILAGVDLEIGPDNEAELLRIAQESVTNAIKHSGASQITIALRHGAGTVDLCVEDNGKGFDPGTTTEGFGLLGMQERAAKIGATMTIESSPVGTSVCVHLKPGGSDAGF